MKKRILLGFTVGLFLVGSASATTISFGGDYSDANKASSYANQAGFLTETFDDGGYDLNWTWSGSGTIVNGSVNSAYAAPFGLTTPDQTDYLVVSQNSTTADLGSSTYNYFGIWWGSVDTHNYIDFYNGSKIVYSISGSQISSAKGSWTKQDQNVYVNLNDLEAFDSFDLRSTGIAFELDNITVGNQPVPEPATMFLFGTGLIGLAGARARRKKK